MNLAEAVKKCAVDAIEAGVPCDVLFGEVVEIGPLKIKVGNMVLEDDVLCLCEHLVYKECRIEFSVYERYIVIHEGLKKGDKVVVVRKCGGEKYVVIGKL